MTSSTKSRPRSAACSPKRANTCRCDSRRCPRRRSSGRRYTGVARWQVQNARATFRTRSVRSPVDPSEIESIRQLKYAYFRLLDLKRFTELGALLTEDATTAYQSGEL